jgi:hypothetical protein
MNSLSANVINYFRPLDSMAVSMAEAVLLSGKWMEIHGGFNTLTFLPEDHLLLTTLPYRHYLMNLFFSSSKMLLHHG